jgi:hypothetical protein
MGRGIEGKENGETANMYYLFFGENCYQCRNYQQYVQKGVALGRRPELVSGGMVGSLGACRKF